MTNLQTTINIPDILNCNLVIFVRFALEMSMVLPKMFAAGNRFTTEFIKMHLDKFGHLIEWRKQPSIMEFGYADGGASRKSFFPFLPADFKEFVASDISEVMVDYAKQRSLHPLMKFVQMDMAAKEVPPEFLNRFDHIFGFFVMHLVKDPRQAFANMHKMLHQGGSIFLTFFEHIPLDDVFDRLSKHPEWGKYQQEYMISPYYYSPDPRKEWETVMKEYFTKYELFEKQSSYEFLDETEFKNITIGVNAVLANIPKEKVEDYKKAYIAETINGKSYSVESRNGEDIFKMKFKMYIVVATKE
uniref:Juvenile hormone acid methyltransferase n=1 Tax=Colaphellus bowringi TaxID=561076 RepID=A0A8G0QFR1_9CUCU|nr:juvenile hormone acid methyltransferase [Colaphellus bowringi]